MRSLILYTLILLYSPQAFAEGAAHSVKITTTQSQTQAVEVTEPAFGRLVDTSSSTVAAEVPARVQQVLVDVGSRVQQGDTLAKLDITDMKLAVQAANAKLKSLQAQVNTQDKLVTRYQTLAKQQFISSTMLEQAQTQLTALKKSVQAARAQLKQAKHNAHRTTIRAPFDGIIQQRFIAAGDYIGVGKPMFQLVRPHDLTAELSIPETRSSSIHMGQEVRLHVPHDAHPVLSRISDTSPAIAMRSNAFVVRARIPHAPGTWYPGRSVAADIITEVHPDAIVVPEDCVVLRPGGVVVYVVSGQHVQAVHVTTGVHQHGMVEITRGLAAGTTIAQIGAAFLTDGAAITVVQP